MDGLEQFFCWNKACPEYGIRGEENIHVRAWYGKHHDIRLLYSLIATSKNSVTVLSIAV